MIRKKLFRGITFCAALGLIIAPAVSAHAESYGAGVTTSVLMDEYTDSAFSVKPEVYINSEEVNADDIKITSDGVYVSLEVVTEKMGDRLEGDISTEYYLRKNNMILMIDFANNKYVLNGVEHNTNMIKLDGKVYASLDFYEDVLNYPVEENGNSYLNSNSRIRGFIRIGNNWDDV